ncbi:MAG: fasciclin domain-containing protein [Leadbetterella sp.]
MKNVSILLIVLLFGCEVQQDTPPVLIQNSFGEIKGISRFIQLMDTYGQGLIDVNKNETIFVPTDEAFVYYDIPKDMEFDKASVLAFLKSQMVSKNLPSVDFKSGKLTIANDDYVRVYNGRAFVQIEESLIEKEDLQVGNLTIHLVDRFFKPELILGHDHAEHASGHSHGGTHDHSMTSNCGAAGPDKNTISQTTSFRTLTSKFLEKLPRWTPDQSAPRTLALGNYSLMGGFNNRLPYIHYFSKENMEDGKFMDPNAPEGLMYGLTSDGKVFPISAVYMTREATSAQLHDLNCMYMFHEHDGLPGVMMHFFHDKYPSQNYGLDHEADPKMVISTKIN